jgi:hypothetical protein
MKQNEKIQTRKDEVRFKTSDIRRIIGKYLATNVLRTWNEDFVDDDTGEVVTIERNEILFERGKYIDNDLATEINFYLQSEDVKEVEVSNQRRLAYENKRTSLYPFKISATIGGKRHNFILQAQNIIKAYEVATDYIELNFTQPFDIVGIKLMDRIIILNDRLRKHVEAQEGANEEDEEEPNKQNYDFVVKTRDVDTAKVVITAWINSKIKERIEKENEECKVVDISILAASPFACNAIVEKAFCLAYKEQEESY